MRCILYTDACIDIITNWWFDQFTLVDPRKRPLFRGRIFDLLNFMLHQQFNPSNLTKIGTIELNFSPTNILPRIMKELRIPIPYDASESSRAMRIGRIGWDCGVAVRENALEGFTFLCDERGVGSRTRWVYTYRYNYMDEGGLEDERKGVKEEMACTYEGYFRLGAFLKEMPYFDIVDCVIEDNK